MASPGKSPDNSSAKKSHSQTRLGSASVSYTNSGSNIGGLMKRDKRTVAVYLKEESSKANNLKPLIDHLDYILDPHKPIDDFESLDSCKWIIAGGLTFEEFGKKGNVILKL